MRGHDRDPHHVARAQDVVQAVGEEDAAGCVVEHCGVYGWLECMMFVYTFLFNGR